MLHEVERHEPLTSAPWNELAARTCIDTIIRDALDCYSPSQLWPSHPQETFSPDARWNLYVGAAGVIWAMIHLAGRAVSIGLPDFSEVTPALVEPNRAWIRGEKATDDPLATCGLLTGDTAILLVHARLSGQASVRRQLEALVDANQDNPVREFMWGSPGTMLSSLWLYDWTGEEIWADKFRRDAAILWERLEFVEAKKCYLWTQHLYGHEALHIGAVHGFAGNAFAVIKGWRLLSPTDQSRWADRLTESLRRTALWEDNCVNWPQSVVKHRPGRTAMLVQHCHGAPGIVNCFAEFPDAVVDDLLIAAGEMTWRAGPLRKGPGLCHGTAGNGYAFLKLFRRTGDARWLDRARRFAAHAIEQHERDEKTYGQRRYSLWTGDLGLAIYLWNCIDMTDGFPTLDNFF
jgi:lantibiotic modifying enzyme